MKKQVTAFLLMFCAFAGYGQYIEYSKNRLEGSVYDDIRLTGFKDNEHAKRVLNAISAKGHLLQNKSKDANGYYITNDGYFVVQTTKKVGLLFKDTYVLRYRPQYLETAIVLEFYQLAFKPWDHAMEGRGYSKPAVNVKPVQKLVDDVKELATLFANNDEELQRVQQDWNQILASSQKEVEEEEKENITRYTNLQATLPGLKNEEFAYEVLQESVKEFNNKSADRNGNGLGAAFTSLVNWKKVKTIEFFDNANNPYGGKLFACAIGNESSSQSGYIIFSAAYQAESGQLVITRVEMLKIPGIRKSYYERSRFAAFKDKGQLGLTSDETYHKLSSYILDELKKIPIRIKIVRNS